MNGSAYGIRTRDTALRGLWLNRLPNMPCAHLFYHRHTKLQRYL